MLDWTATREVRVMPKKRYTPEEIIQHLRTVELETSKGLAVSTRVASSVSPSRVAG